MSDARFPIASALYAARQRKRAYLHDPKTFKRRCCQFVRSYVTIDLRGVA